MNWKPWLLLAGAIGSEVTGSLSLKAATMHPAWYALFLAGFLSAFACLVGVLKAGMPLGVAYGVWGAAGVSITAVASRYLFGEPFTKVMALGIAMVAAGVLLVEMGGAH